jgi:hypothetical protein
MKEDVEVPQEIPRKRRQLEQALDRWLAVWVARDDLTPSERRRVEAERDRRRHLATTRVIGFVAAPEGVTPAQLSTFCQLLRVTGPTEVVHSRLGRRAHGTLVGVCSELGVRHRLVGDVRDEMAAARELLSQVDEVIAAPREATVQTYATPGVWSVIGLARHRSLPTRVVLPDGQLQGDGDDVKA